MMDVMLSLMALIAGGVMLELFAAAPGPIHHQTERGFHMGIDDHELAVDFPPGNPS